MTKSLIYAKQGHNKKVFFFRKTGFKQSLPTNIWPLSEKAYLKDRLFRLHYPSIYAFFAAGKTTKIRITSKLKTEPTMLPNVYYIPTKVLFYKNKLTQQIFIIILATFHDVYSNVN